jgi:hypothetical protein
MMKVVEGGQSAAALARSSPGVITESHVRAAEATWASSPIAARAAKIAKSFFISLSYY